MNGYLMYLGERRLRPGVTLHLVVETIERRNVIYQSTACGLVLDTGLKGRGDYGTQRIERVGCTECRENEEKSRPKLEA